MQGMLRYEFGFGLRLYKVRVLPLPEVPECRLTGTDFQGMRAM